MMKCMALLNLSRNWRISLTLLPYRRWRKVTKFWCRTKRMKWVIKNTRQPLTPRNKTHRLSQKKRGRMSHSIVTTTWDINSEGWQKKFLTKTRKNRKTSQNLVRSFREIKNKIRSPKVRKSCQYLLTRIL